MAAVDPARRKLVNDLFFATWRRIADGFRPFPGSVQKWIDANRPDLGARIAEAEAKVDEAALDFMEGRAPDDAGFRKAGKEWFAAWRAVAAVLPMPEAPAAQPPPAQPAAPAAPATTAPAGPRDFRELRAAVQFTRDAAGDAAAIDFWLVGDYTGEDRLELSVADLERICAAKDTFPGSAVTALRNLAARRNRADASPEAR